ncbi:MAG: feruloyl-CoA synthase [Pseudomonadota bacterium]
MTDPQSDLFATPRVTRRDLADGAFVLSADDPLRAYPETLQAHLDRWASETPESWFLAERNAAGDWAPLTYSEARSKGRAIASGLLRRGLTADTPIMILSDNSIDSALLQFGALYAGIPFAPVSPAYSLLSQDFQKLHHIRALLEPALVFARDGTMFARAIGALGLDDTRVVVSVNPPEGRSVAAFADLIDAAPDNARVDAANAAVDGDTIAKILFTSGSTGEPKGVINTHRMMCSNQQAIAQMWPFLERRPPVILDWLPWNHTFGGNHNFNLVLRNGGTLYIDAGKPVPGLVERTIANLRDVAPTLYFNVPRGFDMILPALESDPAFRDFFFSELDLIFYAAAALPQSAWERLEALSVAARGHALPMTSAWGSTETAPLATSAHFPLDRAGIVGVPAPGTEIKLLPNGDKMELRIRGPNVTPGYYRRPDLTRAAFDADGFYMIGDAGCLADETDPSRGLVFDGRVSEDFKLSTGAWVNTGALRIAVVSAGAPVIQDVVVAGHDRDEIGVLVFPNPGACAALAGCAPETPLADLIAHPNVRNKLIAGLSDFNARSTGSKSRISRAVMMAEPAQIDANEITDKGYINQRAVLDRRSALVEALYDGDEDCGVIVLM